jgi:CRISPR-associated protein Csd1
MILQALQGYYQRKQRSDDPKDRLPAFGLEEKEIPFVIEIDNEGRFVNLIDTRSGEGRKKTGQRFLVPQGVKKTSGVAANLLWDTAEYVLGMDTRGKPERVAQQRTAFRSRLDELPEQVRTDPGLRAVRAFLDRLDMTPLEGGSGRSPDDRLRLESHPAWSDVLAANPILSFRLHGDIELVCQRPAVAAAAVATITDEAAPAGTCLVTGDTSPIERLHPAIKGVWGAQTAGANIVSFNCRAFESYGKTERQGENAPVGKPAVFAYTTALNHLLARDSRQRVQVGDASTVFWAEQPHDLETMTADLFGEPPKDEPDRGADALKALYQSVESGKFAVGDNDTRFHVLGLAPNAARISIRFWETAPAYELARRLKRHFDDLKIVRAPNDPEHLSLFRLLASIAVQGKADNIPPNLGGDIIRAILEDLPYPATLLNAAVQRCRAEQAKKDERTGKPVHHVSHRRAAIFKAYLNQLNRFRPLLEKEITVSLDLSNTHVAYRLGRLFAVFERVQESAAERDLNKTIRDAYFGAAMSTPRAVFPRLIRLNQHHLRDLKRIRPKSAAYFDGLLLEINSELQPDSAFPPVFKLEQQGIFALGYYHQRQAFFSRAEKPGVD